MSSPQLLFREARLRQDKRNVLVIYTGGTIGMLHDKDGSLAPAAGYLPEQIRQLPERGRGDMPDIEIIEYDPLLDSSCMGIQHWVQIATDIENNYLKYDGFVVIMGTDTMSYASSMLSFMLENLDKTVVFTGSQIPFVEIYNDARRNLLVSILFAANSNIPEVCLCFNDKIMRANRSMKVNSRGLDAFQTPNYPNLADLHSTVTEHRDRCLPPPRDKFVVHKDLCPNIVVLKLVPGFDDESIMAMVVHSKNLKAIILEMYGAGNGPSGSKSGLTDALKLAKDRGIITIALSQCLQGGVNLTKYSIGREYQNAGVISGGDMTTEACSTKLSYLFGRYKEPEIVAQLVNQNIRGEITPLKPNQ